MSNSNVYEVFFCLKYSIDIDMILDILNPCKENVLSFCPLSPFCLPYAHFFVSEDIPELFLFNALRKTK